MYPLNLFYSAVGSSLIGSSTPYLTYNQYLRQSQGGIHVGSASNSPVKWPRSGSVSLKSTPFSMTKNYATQWSVRGPEGKAFSRKESKSRGRLIFPSDGQGSSHLQRHVAASQPSAGMGGTSTARPTERSGPELSGISSFPHKDHPKPQLPSSSSFTFRGLVSSSSSSSFPKSASSSNFHSSSNVLVGSLSRRDSLSTLLLPEGLPAWDDEIGQLDESVAYPLSPTKKDNRRSQRHQDAKDRNRGKIFEGSDNQTREGKKSGGAYRSDAAKKVEEWYQQKQKGKKKKKKKKGMRKSKSKHSPTTSHVEVNGEMLLTLRVACELVPVSRRYQLPLLASTLLRFLRLNLRLSNAVQLLRYSLTCRALGLQAVCEDFIARAFEWFQLQYPQLGKTRLVCVYLCVCSCLHICMQNKMNSPCL